VFNRNSVANSTTTGLTPKIIKKINIDYHAACSLVVTLEELTNDRASATVSFGQHHSHRCVLNNSTGAIECTCKKEVEMGRPCKVILALFAEISRKVNHPSRMFWSYLDPKWTSSVFHTVTWKQQFATSFQILALPNQLDDSDLFAWKERPKVSFIVLVVVFVLLSELVSQSKGRKPKVARIPSHGEAPAPAAPKRRVQCGACGAVGHNRKNCPRPNLDRYYETLKGGRFRSATPLSPIVVPDVVVRYVREGEVFYGWLVGVTIVFCYIKFVCLEGNDDYGEDGGDLDGDDNDNDDDDIEEEEVNVFGADNDDVVSEEEIADDILASMVEFVVVPVLSGKPCMNCNNPRVEPSRQFMLISCACNNNCGKQFHCKRDCANPLPNTQQRAGTDRWISECCRDY
jgi:hypothetical protein